MNNNYLTIVNDNDITIIVITHKLIYYILPKISD
jgi:hypothetical protein